MKWNFYAASVLLVLFSYQQHAFGQANTSLSNLVAPVAINKDLTPGATNTYSLGTGSYNWKNIFIAGAYYLRNLRVMHAPGTYNLFLGFNAGSSTVTGAYNTTVGHNALAVVTSGYANTAVGYNSLNANTTGYNNTANGYAALASNTTGVENTATGYMSLRNNITASYTTAYGAYSLYSNTTGYSNTGIGYSTLKNNTTGTDNTALGYLALQFTTTGYENTGVGSYTLWRNTTGIENAALGDNALYDNTTGNNNTATGSGALMLNTTGNGNTANGNNTLSYNTTGSYNTAIGYHSLGENSTASYNTCIGGNTDVSSADIRNGTAIGYNAKATASYQVRIGNGNVTSIGGYVGWSNISDGRFKKNIKENVAGLEFINKLKTITYNLDITGINNRLSAGKVANAEAEASDRDAVSEKEKIVYSGFIAQDVEKAAKELNYDFSGVDAPKNENDMYSLRYADFVVPLVKAVQQLSGKNDSLQQEIATLKQDLAQIQSLLKIKSSAASTLSGASVAQNSPNPFRGNTIIPYEVPEEGNAVAQIVIYDAAGKTIKQYSVPAQGKGTLNLNVSNLPPVPTTILYL
ncbi:MAG: tail fiber domain-containing protein [Agriterribacter sp.]